ELMSIVIRSVKCAVYAGNVQCVSTPTLSTKASAEVACTAAPGGTPCTVEVNTGPGAVVLGVFELDEGAELGAGSTFNENAADAEADAESCTRTVNENVP